MKRTATLEQLDLLLIDDRVTLALRRAGKIELGSYAIAGDLYLRQEYTTVLSATPNATVLLRTAFKWQFTGNIRHVQPTSHV